MSQSTSVGSKSKEVAQERTVKLAQLTKHRLRLQVLVEIDASTNLAMDCDRTQELGFATVQQNLACCCFVINFKP